MKKTLERPTRKNPHNRAKIELGKWGEDLALEFLTNQGYFVVNRNVRTPDGEIDLIVKKDDLLVIVEVKTRRNTDFSYPEDAINEEKLDHIESAVGWYLQQNPEYEENWRLDVVSVIGSPHTKDPRIDWFENVTGE